jgi:cytochrome b561
MHFQTAHVIWLLVVPLVAWRVVARVRRLVGTQESKPWRHWLAAILFPLLTVVICVSARGWALAGLGAGVCARIALAVLGLRLTRFEVVEQKLFYTPNAHIGIALSVLLMLRVGYRLWQVATLTGAAAREPATGFAQSPTTTLLFGLMAGYYASYAMGILRWRRKAHLESR